MERNALASLVMVAALALGPTTATACGEGQFNAGQGLPFQNYLAPRPATVLVYASPDPTATAAERGAIYAGLTKAGHKLTVVSDAGELATALRERHYDIVITAFDAIDTVKTAAAGAENAAGSPKLLPVVARSERRSPQLRSQFDLFLTDGASLGQYLKVIGKAMPANAL